MTAILGGNYFYSDDSSCIRPTDDGERIILLQHDDVLPEGLRKAFWSFVISSAHLLIKEDKQVCNFLIHPGLRMHEHEMVERKVRL